MAQISEEELRDVLLDRRAELRNDLTKLNVVELRRSLEKHFGLEEKALDCQRELISDLVQDLIVGMPSLDGRGVGRAKPRELIGTCPAEMAMRSDHSISPPAVRAAHVPVATLTHMGRQARLNPFQATKGHHKSASAARTAPAHPAQVVVAFRQTGTGAATTCQLELGSMSPHQDSSCSMAPLPTPSATSTTSAFTDRPTLTKPTAAHVARMSAMEKQVADKLALHDGGSDASVCDEKLLAEVQALGKLSRDEDHRVPVARGSRPKTGCWGGLFGSNRRTAV